METVNAQNGEVISPNQTATPERTDADKFNEELQALLNKYPNVRLTIDHRITINQLAPAPESVAGQAMSPQTNTEKPKE